jgi:mono/diheme cytochrome c family protein
MSLRLWLGFLCTGWALAVASASAARPADPVQSPGGSRSGRDLYQAACAACHGADGRGAPRSQIGFDTPVPDFTDCGFATPEPDADWLAVVHSGGPVRAFDRRMPAFGGALTDEEMLRILGHVRTFCVDPAWPRGELNLPRPLVTEKAFPENEAVLTATFADGRVGSEFLYEQRLGARSQFEVAVPVDLQEGADGWNRGLGDIAVAFKRAMLHSLERGTIVSLAGEIVLPTGKESLGLGSGVTVFEPFVAVGQILPSDGFIQAQAGLEVPFDADRAETEAFWRLAVGKSIVQNRFGRTWSPMVELLGARELDAGEPALWDVVPQMQVTLSRRQHVMVNAGLRVPINERTGRGRTFLIYLLWDWFDGGLFTGWR